MAGRHTSMNANTLMRDPIWNEGKRACTVAMHPADAEARQLTDGQMVRVTTEAGSIEIELEMTEYGPPRPCGHSPWFWPGYQGQVYGANVNRLTKNTNRDFLGTPMHRFVPCQVTAL